jgi:hypothetical protein
MWKGSIFVIIKVRTSLYNSGKVISCFITTIDPAIGWENRLEALSIQHTKRRDEYVE